VAPGLQAHLFVVFDEHARGFAAFQEVSFRPSGGTPRGR
jgi:hypothetical protein